MKRTLLLIGLILLTACSMVQTPTPTATPVPPTNTPLPPPPTQPPPPTPIPPTPVPPTPIPTETPVPSETPIPTETLPPAPTVPATPDPHEGQGDLLFEDHFDTYANWGIGDFGNSFVGVDNGVLTMTLGTNHIWRLSPTGNVLTKNRTIADFYAQVTTSVAECRPVTEYGMIFRGSGSQQQAFDQFYAFVVRCNASWKLYRYLDGEFTGIAGSDLPSPAINKGPKATNQLAVRAAGDEFRLYVNGIYLDTTHDEKIPGEGRFAVYGSSFETDRAEFSFDDFSAWHVTP
ncbi:MAG: hypothetical protein HY260_21355 [Chloroflexi bacterium]|nr:hypothetical protein [Chloroflexota bacterium]